MIRLIWMIDYNSLQFYSIIIHTYIDSDWLIMTFRGLLFPDNNLPIGGRGVNERKK